MNTSKTYILLGLIVIILGLVGYKILNKPNYEVVENTVVITDNDIQYLNSIGYNQSEFFDSYYTNQETNSGIAITSDGFEIDWNTTIDQYYIEFDYRSDNENELINLEFYTNSSSIGNLTLFDLDALEPIALDIDQQLLSTDITNFVDQSHQIISNLSTYTFDDTWGTPVNTIIQFRDYQPNGKQLNDGYQGCDIEYSDDQCYTKDNNLFLTAKNSNTVIIDDHNYRLGYRQWITNNIFDDQTTLNSTTEIEIKTDSQVETYELTDLENLQYLTEDYQQQIAASYDYLMTKYEQFTSDYNRELTI